MYLVPPLKGFPLQLGIATWGLKKLEWWGYQAEKGVWRYIQLSGYSYTNVKDGNTTVEIITLKKLTVTHFFGICYLCEELSDAWQWDMAYESLAWIKDESHWNEYDEMDVWG